MLGHTEIQLDFILEMYANDNPKEFSFRRPGQNPPRPEHELLAEWDRVLIGKAKETLFARMMPSKAVLQRAMGIMDAAQTLKKAASEGEK